MKIETRQWVKQAWEETKRIYTPRTRGDWIIIVLTLWTSISGFTVFVFGVHLARTWITFLVLFLPSLLTFGSVAYTYTCVLRLRSTYSQRYATWFLFGRTSGSLWPVRFILIVPLLASIIMSGAFLWAFMQL